jgi:hypothetical protein
LPSLSVGFAYTRTVEPLNGRLIGALGLNNSLDGRTEASQVAGGSWGGDVQAGLEYWYGRLLAARIGSDAGFLTAGGGIRIHDLGADYAYLANADLGATHRVSASIRF